MTQLIAGSGVAGSKDGSVSECQFFEPHDIRPDPNDPASLICCDSKSVRRIKGGAA
jgi:hypothetical protein